MTDLTPYANVRALAVAQYADWIDIHEARYDSGWEVDRILVPWAEVEDFDATMAALKRAISEAKHKQARDAEAARREQYKRLQAEFGGTDSGE